MAVALVKSGFLRAVLSIGAGTQKSTFFLKGRNNLPWRCKDVLYSPVINTHTFLPEFLADTINPKTLSVLIYMEDVWKATQKTISFCGKLLSLSMFSTLPSVWSINLYLCWQFTLTLKIWKSFCPAVFSTLICNTVGRTYSKHSGHPVSFQVYFTNSEPTVCFSSDISYKHVLSKAMRVCFVLRNKKKNDNKKSICNCFLSFSAELSGKKNESEVFSSLSIRLSLISKPSLFVEHNTNRTVMAKR